MYPRPRQAQYPITRKMVIVRGRGTAGETRIETGITMHLLTRNGAPVLDAAGRPIYVTIPTD